VLDVVGHGENRAGHSASGELGGTPRVTRRGLLNSLEVCLELGSELGNVELASADALLNDLLVLRNDVLGEVQGLCEEEVSRDSAVVAIMSSAVSST